MQQRPPEARGWHAHGVALARGARLHADGARGRGPLVSGWRPCHARLRASLSSSLARARADASGAPSGTLSSPPRREAGAALQLRSRLVHPHAPLGYGGGRGGLAGPSPLGPPWVRPSAACGVQGPRQHPGVCRCQRARPRPGPNAAGRAAASPRAAERRLPS